jgi:hypothetical protein
MKLVKVARVGTKLKEVCIHDRDRIQEALTAAGMAIAHNEDVWVDHRIVDPGEFIDNGKIIILEPRKRVPMSDAMKEFIDIMIEHEIVDGYDYEDEDEYLDYDELYEDNKDMIDSLISKAKEA